MDAIELFRQEHDLVRQVVDGLVLAGMGAAQLHPPPGRGARPAGLLFWHATHYEDVVSSAAGPPTARRCWTRAVRSRTWACRRRTAAPAPGLTGPVGCPRLRTARRYSASGGGLRPNRRGRAHAESGPLWTGDGSPGSR